MKKTRSTNNKSKNKKMTKSQKGITLVALVITIIILIILATVAINFAFGNNGLITEAEKAKDFYTNDSTYTDESFANVESYIDGIIGETTDLPENAFATQITSEDYGKYVKYNVDYDNDDSVDDDWRIFYNDGTHVYLISSDYVIPEEYQSAQGGYRSLNLFSLGYTTSDSAIEFLLDTENWTMLNDGELAEYVTGATTMEMYAQSWNSIHEEKIYLAEGENGLLVGTTNPPTDSTICSFSDTPEDLYFINKGQMPYNSTYYMWVASKGNNGNVLRAGSNISCDERSNTTGGISGNVSGAYYVGIRPIVCLQKDVVLTGGDGVSTPFEITK